jgi:CheY-like chemotaxis protein
MEQVLLVEDDDDLRDVLGVAFSAINGWQVVSAGDATGALAVLGGQSPSLVVCDLHLGDAFATEVMDAAAKSGIPTIVLTASRVDARIREMVPDGVCTILEKPTDPHALCELGRELVAASGPGSVAVTSFIAVRRPRIAREALAQLSDDAGFSRQDVHRLVGRLATYGLTDPALALREAEEVMATGRSGADASVRLDVDRARRGLTDFLASEIA